MIVMMGYLVAFLSLWRPASPTNGNRKAVKLKATMAAKCAAELSNWLGGVRALTTLVLIVLGPL